MATILKKIQKLPASPGVYFFLNSRKKILYIGKAGSLKDRVKSYFRKDLLTSRSPLIKKMTLEARDVSFQKTDSVLEALILEADLIKKFKPKYNSKEKDDKSFNYVVITKEDFPRVLLVRGKDLESFMAHHKARATFGPFPQGSILKEALKIIRKIFPFRDTCAPYAGATTRRPCFNRQIGLCPGACTGEVLKAEYQKTIRNIRLLFGGKKKILLKNLTKEMNALARKEAFEKAGEVKKTVFALKHIQDISLMKETSFSTPSELEDNRGTMRIEGYDVAHTSGTHTVGVMVVAENGEPSKEHYRKFNIRAGVPGSDTGALLEIIERRLGHEEWALPRLVVVDGGKAQIHVVEDTFKKYGIRIPVVGVVKDEHHRAKKILGEKSIARRYEREILLVNSEAHRFALAFHRKKRRATF